MLDEEHADFERDATDNVENLNALGSISSYNVAIVCLPAGQTGNNPAAAMATQMRATYKKMVRADGGHGGGVPSAETDVRLGDVVVSEPHGTFAGIVQYKTGKTTPSGFERTGALNSLPQMLLVAVARVRANQLRKRSKLFEHAANLEGIAGFSTARQGLIFCSKQCTITREGRRATGAASTDTKRRQTRGSTAARWRRRSDGALRHDRVW